MFIIYKIYNHNDNVEIFSCSDLNNIIFCRLQVMGNCGPLNAENVANSMCIRTGCGNPAMHSQHCNNEFCSNDCVVSHCR